MTRAMTEKEAIAHLLKKSVEQEQKLDKLAAFLEKGGIIPPL